MYGCASRSVLDDSIFLSFHFGFMFSTSERVFLVMRISRIYILDIRISSSGKVSLFGIYWISNAGNFLRATNLEKKFLDLISGGKNEEKGINFINSVEGLEFFKIRQTAKMGLKLGRHNILYIFHRLRRAHVYHNEAVPINIRVSG